MEYNVSVSKRFLLTLDEDADPLEILKRVEQEKEAKRKEKLVEKNKQDKEAKTAPAAAQQQPSNKKASRTNKENQQQQQQQAPQQPPPPQQQQQQQPRGQDAKKEQGDKKPGQQKFGGGDRNVKFASENREDHSNRRIREDGERPPRAQNDFKRGPPGEQRDQRDYPYQGTREYRNSNISGTGGGGVDGERRPRGPPRGGGGGGERGGGGGGERGGFRGGFRGRGGRGGFDSRGKREYDRQSGSDKTGVKPIDKKDGAGSHNWGNHNDDIEDAMNPNDDWGTPTLAIPDANADTTVNASENKENSGSPNVSAVEAPTGDATAPVAEEKPAEEEARELTLDEWKALRQTNRVKPTYNLRKAGEGEDLSRWKKMYALERKKEGVEDEDEDEDEYDAAEYPQRVGRQKHVLDIEINFNDSRRSGGGRGGRGGRGGNRMNGRGFSGGRGGPPREGGEFRNQEQRSPRERQNAPKVDDEHDFPSLG